MTKKIPIVLDKPRNLLFNLNAMSLIEENTGLSVLGGNFYPRSAGQIRGVLYSLLKHEDPELTIDAVGDMLGMANIKDIMELVSTALGSDLEIKEGSLAPYVPTPDVVVDMMVGEAKPSQFSKVIDLGCGDGRLIFAALKFYPTVIGHGYDYDEKMVNLCRKRAPQLGLQGRAKFIQGDIRQADIKVAGAIFVYLLTSSNEEIREKLEKELPRGSKVVSHDFQFKWPEANHLQIKLGDKDHHVYIYNR